MPAQDHQQRPREDRQARLRRVIVAATAASIVLGTAGATAVADASSAAARPNKPGQVTGLAIGTITKSGATYEVPVTWDSVARATSYQATMKAKGVVLDRGTVTGTTWTGRARTAAGTEVRVTVRALAQRAKGRPASIAMTLPDLSAPVGEFSATWIDTVATITQLSITDDVSTAAGITRTVNWGEPGGSDEPWTTGTTLEHSYPAVEARYVPRVTLTDEAGNSVTQDLNAVVIQDSTAPTGSFTTNPGEAWAALTPVHLTGTGISDNWTPASLVARTVSWGDDSAPEVWTGDEPLAHVYATAGTYTPSVTLTDEAGNDRVVEATPVVVTADTIGPVVRLKLPRSHRKEVSSWRVLRGRASDQGTGVAGVRVRVVERRGATWFAYKPVTRRWVKAPNRAIAYARAGVITGTPSATGGWKVRVWKLKVGQLHYKVRATDKVGNLSNRAAHKQRLTRY